jgi:hypothetical protein
MPVQYTPQFVPTDVNLMNQMLQQRQQEHDMALARIAETEDKFGQMRVDPSDIGYKNELLGDFQQNIGNIIDRYGGDPGAASKDITRQLTKFRNDPFFQLAPYKSQLIEEARKREAQLGPNAIVGRGVQQLRETPLYSKEMGYAAPEDFQHSIMDRRDFQKSLEAEYGDIGRRTRESGLGPSGIPGYLESVVTKGITSNEAGELKQDMFEHVKRMSPDIPDEIAIDMADNYANQLIQGYQRQHVRDLGYDPKAEEKARQRRNYIVSTGTGDITGMSIPEAKKGIESYLSSVNDYNKVKNAPSKTREDFNNINEYTQYVENQSRINNIAENKYKKSLKQFQGKMLNELKSKYGLNEEEAVKVVAMEKASTPITHENKIRPTAKESLDGIVDDLNVNLRGINLDYVDVYDSLGNKKERTREKFEEEMKEDIAKGNIQDVTVDLKSGDIILISESGKSYGIPSSSLGNKGVSQNISSYKKLMSTLYSDVSGTSKPVVVGDKLFLADKRYDKESNRYESKLFLIDPVEKSKQEVNESDFNDIFFTGLFATYGQQGEYKPTYLNK